MTTLSGHADGATVAGLMTTKVEAQFRGHPEALKRLREVLADAGVYVQVDHEYTATRWGGDTEGLIIAGLMAPAAERIEASTDD